MSDRSGGGGSSAAPSASDSVRQITTAVCIAGGGPAGMMCGLLLARAGIDVVVLEKHRDFLRDFRGDTIHPSTLDLLEQLDLLDGLENIDHTSVTTLDVVLKGVRVTAVNFGLLRRGAKRLVMMPQWDLLELLASAAKALPSFHLIMEAEATGLIQADGVVIGVHARSGEQELRIEAILTVAADGRSSTLRAASGLKTVVHGVAIDVLWFRVPRPACAVPDTLAYITDESMVVTIPRIGYFQTALLIQKNAFGRIRASGIEAFQRVIVDAAPVLASTISAVGDFDQVQLLSVQIDRLQRWHSAGFLAIGDAAHAMSPAGGVGINYAFQDAVAAANILVEPLRAGAVSEHDLARVQRRREPAVRYMQALQRMLHTFIGRPGGGRNLPPARVLRVVSPLLTLAMRPIAARLIGRGFRPERIDEGIIFGPVRRR